MERGGDRGYVLSCGSWEVYCWLLLSRSWALGRWGPWVVGCGSGE